MSIDPNDQAKVFQEIANSSGGDYLKWCLIVNSGAIIAVLTAAARLPALGIEATSILTAVSWWIAGAATSIAGYGFRYVSNTSAAMLATEVGPPTWIYRVHLFSFVASIVTGLATGFLFLIGAIVIIN